LLLLLLLVRVKDAAGFPGAEVKWVVGVVVVLAVAVVVLVSMASSGTSPLETKKWPLIRHSTKKMTDNLVDKERKE
jgi:hypothetical protein